MFFFRPFLSTQPGVSFHATAPRRDGEKDLPAHRRPAAVRRGIVNRRKLYVFSTKNGKRKVGLFPLKGKKPSCIRGEKRYNHLAVRPGGRCVGALFTWTGFRELPLPETAAFLFFGFIVTIFVENSKRENKNFCDFPGRPGCLPPLPRCPRAAFFTGFLPGFLGVSGGFPAGTELTGKTAVLH